MHQLALAYSRAGLHAGHIAGPLGQAETGHAGRDGAGGDDQVLILIEIELIHHGAQQIGVNLSPGGDQAGADFYDDSHIADFLAFVVPDGNGIALGEGGWLSLVMSWDIHR
jgi:hypothetical protein